MIRIIPRLDIKGSHLIKGIKLEGLRKVGSPSDFAKKYYEQGADELIYMDAVASLYGRNSLTELIKETVKSVFIPITVGGGIRTIEDVRTILRSGADKVAINTAAINRPELITDVANTFGRQCMVLSVEAIKQSNGRWLAFTDNGREHTGLDVVTWVQQAVDLGAGEILLTSVDQEGGIQGYDIDLIHAVSEVVDVPVIASGGFGCASDAMAAVAHGAKAVSMAHYLHYEKGTVRDIREALYRQSVAVRPQGTI